jgi:hypothetical protein
MGFYNFESSIDISSYRLPPEELAGLFARVIKDDPYLFFVNPRLSYTYVSGGCVLTLKPDYIMSPEETVEAIGFCLSEIVRISDMASGLKGDLEKALFLHDYVCQAFSYDVSLESNNMYSFLLMGSGTCQGYAHTYSALLRQVGIETSFVASDTISHIWNLVKLDGEWYHVDLTWDDSHEGVVRRHFLCSDAAALERGHKDWYSVNMTVCESEKYREFDFDLISHGEIGSGDVDHSGRIDILDAVSLRLALTEDSSVDREICQDCADINGDGMVTDGDLALLRDKLLLFD